ncbi:hypothetical protein QZM39_13895 [Burkholderia cenocepacia]|uniref:hypothetical protein n=1 Tax=Burkholderia cenocepacia TaxID=95486 RepID=UPI00264B7297|nr:hypothetical protein [Burkholderia cenocepacia]MDN7620933.1 hypothetical protein [Burkholderia cenocepacia]
MRFLNASPANGISRMRCPVASKIALASAARSANDNFVSQLAAVAQLMNAIGHGRG